MPCHPSSSPANAYNPIARSPAAILIQGADQGDACILLSRPSVQDLCEWERRTAATWVRCLSSPGLSEKQERRVQQNAVQPCGIDSPLVDDTHTSTPHSRPSDPSPSPSTCLHPRQASAPLGEGASPALPLPAQVRLLRRHMELSSPASSTGDARCAACRGVCTDMPPAPACRCVPR